MAGSLAAQNGLVDGTLPPPALSVAAARLGAPHSAAGNGLRADGAPGSGGVGAQEVRHRCAIVWKESI